MSPFTIGSTDTIELSFSVPITGWSSSVQTSDQTDTRVVAASFTGSTTSVTAAGSVVVPTTVLSDSHGSFSGSTYTVPVSGFYSFEGFLRFNAAVYAVGDSVSLFLRVNGSTDYLVGQYRVTSTSSLNYATSGSFTVFLNSGNTIQFLGASTVTNTLSGANGFVGSIKRVSGPSAIAATETVSLKYSNTAGTSIAAAGTAPVSYATKAHDTHNAWNGSTFTAPVGGKYRVTVNAAYANASFTTGTASISVRKNTTLVDFISILNKWANINIDVCLNGSGEYDLVSGDTLDIRLVHNEGTARTLNTTAGTNYVCITRVGN